ncbi:MAG TPA: SRPBCC family protein [Dongiaceae bacterium]|nr:SRPBCC family protein [Dongiaceae bacterium]
MTSSTNPALDQWALDREIVLSRVIRARRDVVFSAWADARHLPNWFGPAGFEIETKEIDIRVVGLWRFDMIAPDGRRYTNRMQFRRIEPPALIEFDHGAADDPDDPGRFRTTVTFDEQSDGKTVITLRQLHPTKAQRDAGIGFGAVEYGYQTLEKLARHVESLRA